MNKLPFGYYNMDCMEGMKRFPDKYFDLAIVDPPYGIDVGTASMGAGGGVAPHRNRSAANIKGGAVHIGGAKQFSNSGGVSASRPKFITRLMIQKSRMKIISRNSNEWQKTALSGAVIIS